MNPHTQMPVVMPLGLRQAMRVLPLALLAPGLLLPAAAQIARLPEGPQLSRLDRQNWTTANPIVRVLVFEGPGLDLAAAAGPLLLRDAAGRVLVELSPGQTLQVAPDPLSAAGLRWQLSDGQSTGVSDSDLWLEPVVPEARLRLEQRQYRGQGQLRRVQNTLQAINHVPLEAYLPSVVGSEMPPSWPQPALRAQAVAARTYALRQRRANDPFDLRATVSSQVYRGVESETDSTREAVEATRGQVLTYAGSLIEAVFHSSSGGSTEASGELWAQQLPYLVPVRDVDEHSPVRSWEERFEPEQLQRLFADLGGLTTLTVISRTGSGRVAQVRVEGPAGVLVLSGAQLRQRLGLRSTQIEIELLAQPQQASSRQVGSQPELVSAQPGALVELPPLPVLVSSPPALLIRGRGFGHGIGMSQWGAYGLALRGVGHDAILSHYYPGTQLDAFRGP